VTGRTYLMFCSSRFGERETFGPSIDAAGAPWSDAKASRMPQAILTGGTTVPSAFGAAICSTIAASGADP
jgi:hypothetical protein